MWWIVNPSRRRWGIGSGFESSMTQRDDWYFENGHMVSISCMFICPIPKNSSSSAKRCACALNFFFFITGALKRQSHEIFLCNFRLKTVIFVKCNITPLTPPRQFFDVFSFSLAALFYYSSDMSKINFAAKLSAFWCKKQNWFIFIRAHSPTFLICK